jgi:hypothetical protein
MIVGIGHRHEIAGKIVPHVRLEIALRKLVQRVGKRRQRLRLLRLDPGRSVARRVASFADSVRALGEGSFRLIGRIGGEFLKGRLQVFEIADVFDRRPRHGHVAVEDIRRVLAEKTDAGDQDHTRPDEQKDLGNDPAALQKMIDEMHAENASNAMSGNRPIP